MLFLGDIIGGKYKYIGVVFEVMVKDVEFVY